MRKKVLRSLILGIFGLAWLLYVQSKQPSPPPAPARLPTPAKVSLNPRHPQDFNEAKSLLKRLYPSGQEIYCGCNYNLDRVPRIDRTACGFKGQGARSQRIEWEHVVPASVFGRHFVEWTKGHPDCWQSGHMEKGRACARKTSAEFRYMEADLYNLLPAVGTLNGARSDYAYGEIKGEAREFGGCDFEVSRQIVEPRPEIRGDLARIYFYMDAQYPGFNIITKENTGLLAAWDRDDPMDEYERVRLSKIAKQQGNSFFIGRLARLASAERP